MRIPRRLIVRLVVNVALLAIVACRTAPAAADSGQSTRVTDPRQHARTGSDSYPYRAKADYVLGELDLKPGDVVVDIGAGDGWWSERMAQKVGEEGIVYAAEVDRRKVDAMKKKYAPIGQIRPYLCKTDDTTLPENSCDLAFFSQSYHHLPKDGRVEYLQRLHSVIRPTGRVCIIEKYTLIATVRPDHGTNLSTITAEAEKAGWVPVRCELMTGTNHSLTILVQKELFAPEPASSR